MKRPNILLITTDQQRWDTVGVYNSKIKTPSLNRLAADGIVFDRAYTVNPVCTPSRCSMLTGHYPSRHGCYTIGTNLPEDYPSVPAILGRNGYATSLVGKGHFHACLDPQSFESEPHVMNRDFFRNWHGPFHGFERAELVIGHTVEPKVPGMHYGLWLEDRGVNAAKHFGNNKYTDYGVWNLPEEHHPSKWTADITMEEIDRAQRNRKPFFIWSSFQDPHNPCMVPEPWASMYDPADMPDHRYRDGEFRDKPSFYQGCYDARSAHGYGRSIDFGEKDWHCTCSLPDMTSEKTRDLIARYYGMMSLVDHHIGRIVDHLEQKRLLENTVIVFTNDHGDYLGNHGFWWKGLQAYEDVHRMPMIVRHPRCTSRGAHSRAYQSNVDYGRSFLSLAGVAPPPLMQGVDQSGAWQDCAVSARDHAILEFRPTEAAFMQKVFWYDRHKLVVYSDATLGELYDLSSDPDQYRNLWDDPASQDVKQSLILRFIAAEMGKDGVLRERTAAA
jgi:uncharacterized sulfatase